MSIKSVEAFLEQVRTGEHKNNAQKIYAFLQKHGSRNLDRLREQIFMPHQTLTGKLSLLCDMGIIWEDDNGYFHVSEQWQIPYMAKEREMQRYRKWRKLGEDNGWFGQMMIV